MITKFKLVNIWLLNLHKYVVVKELCWFVESSTCTPWCVSIGILTYVKNICQQFFQKKFKIFKNFLRFFQKFLTSCRVFTKSLVFCRKFLKNFVLFQKKFFEFLPKFLLWRQNPSPFRQIFRSKIWLRNTTPPRCLIRHKLPHCWWVSLFIIYKVHYIYNNTYYLQHFILQHLAMTVKIFVSGLCENFYNKKIVAWSPRNLFCVLFVHSNPYVRSHFFFDDHLPVTLLADISRDFDVALDVQNLLRIV